jgi:RNA polymerase sigma-70 factor (ECF subfamily)
MSREPERPLDRTPCDTVLTVRAKEPGSDAALMRAFAEREPTAAADLYGRFASRVYGLGIVMLGGDAAAQDLVQDTFVKLWRNADHYDPGRGKLETWVLLVARSLAIDSLRRRVLEARVLERTAPAREASDEPGPDHLVETADMSERARHAMSALTDGQRAALELAYFGGKTSAEVAELEGIPLGTAKTRIRTALLKLRDALEEHARDV